MILMNKVVLVAFATVLNFTIAQAQVKGTVSEGRSGGSAEVTYDAWISKSEFNGEVFKYEYVAYDVRGDVSATLDASCSYGLFADKFVVKALNLKLKITGSFDNPGRNVVGTGTVNVKEEIAKCEMAIPSSRASVVAPVQVNLPPISVPSH